MFAAGTEAAVTQSAGWFLENAWLIAVVPAVAFFLIIFFGKRMPKGGSEIGIASMFASTVLAAGAAYQWVEHVRGAGAETGGEAEHHVVSAVTNTKVWFSVGQLNVTIGSFVDGLAVTVLLLVAFISTLVQIYSTEYVRGDRRYTHYFAAITLFSAGMLTMVLAPNMVQFILGWEIMGLCSFMLIGHWWEELPNAKAALKAFWTVRVGDIGLLVGTAILLAIFGTLEISDINTAAAGGAFTSKNLLTGAAIALFIACIGKSGQFPLHTWLPDAMAGPTPVSSLLHSSTMVVGGVYLVARLYPVFHVGFDINIHGQEVNFISVIGGITILIAALLAFVQNDIKKVLAYSTVSQLGYMMMGLGVGAWTAAVFHIFTHAFFKCALFLCAGSVAHTGSHHSFDMKTDMGGLWRKMPITFGVWMVSTAALMGIPFFSGFFSKDEIIDSAKHNGYQVFWYVGIIGAFMTAAYMTRATYLTFFGTPRGGAQHFVEGHIDLDEELAVDEGHAVAFEAEHPELAHAGHGHGHDDHHAPMHHGKPLPFAKTDSSWQITVPILILGALALVAGFLNAPAFRWHWFEHHVAAASGLAFGEGSLAVPEPPEFSWTNALPGLLLIGAGVVLAAVVSVAIYNEAPSRLKGLTERIAPLRWGYTFLVNKYYLDALYENVIVHAIAHPIARAANWFNQRVIDAVVNGAGSAGRKSGGLLYKYVDQKVVDGVVNGSGSAAEGAGHTLQPVQSGKVSMYGALLFGAAAVAGLALVLVNT